MRSSSVSWFVAIIFLSFTCNNFSLARYLKKLNSVVVVGTVYCNTCIQEDFSKARHFISGALVAVECENENSKLPTFRQEAKTNEKGEFKMHLPFSVPKNAKQIKGCFVKLLKSSEPFCAVASSSKNSSTLHFESKKQGARVYSAGLFTFKPSNQPNLCNKKPKKELKLFQSPQDVNFPLPTPKIPILPAKKADLSASDIYDTMGKNVIPQIPFVPSPPTFLGIPFPPNPFQPPPSIFPPIPNPFQPPPSIFPPINFPPLVPGLILSPPPPPPVFPIPLPPFPFPPGPGFPGFPPSSNKASP